jgi:hypothetical protein
LYRRGRAGTDRVNWHTPTPLIRPAWVSPAQDTGYQFSRKVAAVDNPPSPSRWFAGWRSAARPDDDDAADFGTAFGMEMSLPETPAAPAPPPASVDDPPSWVQRLTSRRRPAA